MKKKELPTIKKIIEKNREERERKLKLSKQKTNEFLKKIKEY
ncbi:MULTISPECIES: hypothetical protein [Gottfriedia]|nr:hypothetical protein [Gottfriedia acidiceleris]